MPPWDAPAGSQLPQAQPHYFRPCAGNAGRGSGTCIRVADHSPPGQRARPGSVCHSWIHPGHQRHRKRPPARKHQIPSAMPCSPPWGLTPSAWTPCRRAPDTTPPHCRCNSWKWNLREPFHAFLAVCFSAWAALDHSVHAASAKTYPSSRSGFALSLASASRVARTVSPSSSRATNKPACMYAPRRRSWIR